MQGSWQEGLWESRKGSVPSDTAPPPPQNFCSRSCAGGLGSCLNNRVLRGVILARGEGLGTARLEDNLRRIALPVGDTHLHPASVSREDGLPRPLLLVRGWGTLSLCPDLRLPLQMLREEGAGGSG